MEAGQPDKKFTKIIFKSTSVTKTTASKYKIIGDLTLHGVTKQIILDAHVRTGMGMHNKPVATAGLKISGTIIRTDFGITKYPPAMLGDEITLNANGEFNPSPISGCCLASPSIFPAGLFHFAFLAS